MISHHGTLPVDHTRAELPYTRLHWPFDPHRAVLLIHDMQEYFLDFYDAVFTELVDGVKQLRSLGLPTIYTVQPAPQSAGERGLLLDRWGAGIQDRADIVAELKPTPSDVVLTKKRYSAFLGTDLAERLRRRHHDQLVVCGVYAHIGSRRRLWTPSRVT